MLANLKIPPKQGQKKAPLQTYIFYCPFLPPLPVAAMSTLHHELSLSPMVPHHFLLQRHVVA